jgi:5-methylcytosine-specific restriction protein A
MAENWTEEELEAAVRAYVDMRDRENRGERVIKSAYYRDLHEEFGRSAKSYEYRMQNISYVYALLGRRWVEGLKPAQHVGTKVIAILERAIAKVEGQSGEPFAQFEHEVEALRKSIPKQAPIGNATPAKIQSTSTQFVREPEVVAWVLNAANGKCECCGKDAPFTRIDGTPYLEVHHLKRLADGGSDRVSNAIALCPNCHRELHFGIRRTDLLSAVFPRIPRLIEE